MEIRLPETLNDCTPDQLGKWVYLTTGDFDLSTLVGKLDFKVQVLSIFSNLSKDELNLADYKDVNKAFSHMISVLASHDPKEPKGEIEIKGKRYVWDKDFRNINTGQIVDIKLIDSVYENPRKVLATLYIEEGLVYNQLDEHKRIINKSDERELIFKEFDGVEFLNVFAFFLNRYDKLKTATFILQMAMMKKNMDEIQKELRGLQSGTYGHKTL